MSTRDPRVDQYIEKSAAFAKPILTHLREVVHQGCPDVEETMKWSFPHFMYKGMFASMASFKQHCAFGFWQSARILDDTSRSTEAMGQFGRITSLTDLPPRTTLLRYVRKAKALKDAGVKAAPRSKTARRKPLRAPNYFMTALRKNKRALAAYEEFSPSHRREYIEWVTEAKGDDTRKRRLSTAIEWMAEGKSRNWKYLKA